MRNVYRLKEFCDFFAYDGQANETAFIVRTPDGRHFKISSAAKEMLAELDGKATLDSVAAKLGSRSIQVTTEDLLSLMVDRYEPLGIVEKISGPPVSQNAVRRIVRLPFLLHWNVIPVRHVQWLSGRLEVLFSSRLVMLAIFLIVAAHYFVYFGYSALQYSGLGQANSVYVLALVLLSILCHEFGHSSAVSRYGGSPGGIGFGLFVLLPSFYADVSEAWRFSRKQRMVVDLGGVFFQLIFFVVIALVGGLTSRQEFFAACRFIDLLVFVNLNPVFRFDGYWLLADWLALPNLHRLSTGLVVKLAKRLLGRGCEGRIFPQLPLHACAVLLIYSVLSVVSLIVMLGLSLRYITATIAKVPLVIPEATNSVVAALDRGDSLYLFDRLLVLFFSIAFPVTIAFGLYSYGAILVRHALVKVKAARQSP